VAAAVVDGTGLAVASTWPTAPAATHAGP